MRPRFDLADYVPVLTPPDPIETAIRMSASIPTVHDVPSPPTLTDKWHVTSDRFPGRGKVIRDVVNAEGVRELTVLHSWNVKVVLPASECVRVSA